MPLSEEQGPSSSGTFHGLFKVDLEFSFLTSGLFQTWNSNKPGFEKLNSRSELLSLSEEQGPTEFLWDFPCLMSWSFYRGGCTLPFSTLLCQYLWQLTRPPIPQDDDRSHRYIRPRTTAFPQSVIVDIFCVMKPYTPSYSI